MERDIKEFTALRRLLHDTIQSFPLNSHRQFESFFLDRRNVDELERNIDLANEDPDKINEQSLQNVRKAWARAVVKSQAFTKKPDRTVSQTAVIAERAIEDPIAFTEDVISDLSLGKHDYARLISNADRVIGSVGKAINSSSSPTKLKVKAGEETQAMANEEVYASLANTMRVGEDLNFLLLLLNKSPMSETGRSLYGQNDFGADAVIEFRQWARKVKIHWNSQLRLSVNYANYAPINLQLLGPADTIFGVTTSEEKQSPWAADVDHVCGVRVLSKSLNVQSRAWVSYDCYTKFTVSRRYNIFPVVLKADRESNFLLLSFEAPACRPVVALMNPILCTFLFRSPVILRLWCSQLVLAQQMLLALPNQSKKVILRRKPTLDDFHVRDDGRLILLNALFEEQKLSSSIDSCRRSTNIIELIQVFIANVLCLSRSVCVSWKADEQADSRERASSTAGKMHSKVIYVMEGSLLTINISDFCEKIDEQNFTCEQYLDGPMPSDGSQSKASTRSKAGTSVVATLNEIVDYEFSSVEEDFSGLGDTKSCKRITVTAKRPGTAWIRYNKNKRGPPQQEVDSKLSRNHRRSSDNSQLVELSEEGSANINRDILIVVINKPTALNVEIIELVALMEESFRMKTNVHQQARLFSAVKLMDIVHDDAIMTDCLKNWSAFLQVL